MSNNIDNSKNLPDIFQAGDEFFNKVLNDMNQKVGVIQGTSAFPQESTTAFDVRTSNSGLTDIANQVSNYRDSYTDTCFRRTAPYGGTMPLSFERWLRAVDIATSKNNGKRVKVDVASSIYSQVEKETQSTYSNLCRMTAEPFPLVSSGKANDANSDKVSEQPLIDPQNGARTASRYARICLSPLGRYATKWYHDVSMQALKIHKSIVPLCLLRKTQAWTLGFKTEMRPLNPSELFHLMAKMMELNSPDLSDDVLQQFFRGPDLGEDYIIYMTNESLMSLYSTGKGSITVVPMIQVDRTHSRIIIKRPVLDQTSQKLATSLHKKLIDYYERGEAVGFRTFEMGDSIIPNGKNTYIKVKRFIGTDEQIVAEIMSTPEFQKTVSLTNAVLLPLEGNETNTARYEGINYKCELMSIKDTLWMHIQWERENVKEYYTNRRKDLVVSLERAKLLDKVTRPKVADFIHRIMRQPDRTTILEKVFSKDPNVRALTKQYNKTVGIDCTTLRQELIDEGLKLDCPREFWSDDEEFTSEEAMEVFKERGGLKIGTETINILSILFLRHKYRDFWAAFEKAIDECDMILGNPALLDKEIILELEKHANMTQFKRKSPVYFLDPETKSKSRRKTTDAELMIKPIPTWDRLVQPVSIFYDGTTLCKSYGINMNINLKISVSRANNKPKRSINCLNNETLLLYSDNSVTKFRPCDIAYTPYKFNFIRGIIPYSEDRRILVLYHSSEVYNGQEYMKSRIDIIEPKGANLKPLTDNEAISAWVYLDDVGGKPYPDDKCVLFLHFRPMDTNTNRRYSTGTSKIKISDIKITDKQFPPHWGFVTDLELIDADETVQPVFLMGNYDCYDPGSRPTVEIGGNPGVFTIDMDFTSFSTHLEFYLGRDYICNWGYNSIVRNCRLDHIKRGVIREKRFLYRREAVSERLLKEVRSQIVSKWNSIHRVNTRFTEAYMNWRLSDLEDWSIIDKRFGFPDNKPSNKDAIEFCDRFFESCCRFDTKIVDSPRRHLLKMGISFSNPSTEELKDGFNDTILDETENETTNIDNQTTESLSQVYDFNNE